jgi:hypothetical protein
LAPTQGRPGVNYSLSSADRKPYSCLLVTLGPLAPLDCL